MKRNVLLLLTILLISGQDVFSQCCSGGVPMSGNLGLPQASKGTVQASVAYDLNILETLKSGSSRLDDDLRSRRTHSTLLEVGYTLSDKWTIDVLIPYIVQQRFIQNASGETTRTITRGIGDASLLVKYQLFSRTIVGYGLKLPTGASDKTANGIALNADLQPGSGAWDHIAYAQHAMEGILRPSTALSITSIYRWRGLNDSYLGTSRYQFGNEFSFNVAISDRLLVGKQFIEPMLATRFRNAQRDAFNDFGFSSSGGSFVFLGAGLSLLFTEDVSWSVNAEVPLYARVNEIQVAPSYRITTALFLKFPEKLKL